LLHPIDFYSSIHRRDETTLVYRQIESFPFVRKAKQISDDHLKKPFVNLLSYGGRTMEEEIRFAKMVIGGDPAVGKTSLRARYLGKGFKTEYIQTLGADFAVYETPIKGIILRWQIWDLAGATRFYDVLKRFYYGSFGALVVYDVTRPETREAVIDWVRDIWAHSSYEEKIPIVILENKVDLVEELMLEPEGAEDLARIIARAGGRPVPWLETSAKTGYQVREAFEELGKQVIDFTNDLSEEVPQK
jgi:small GTP-binding protein